MQGASFPGELILIISFSQTYLSPIACGILIHGILAQWCCFWSFWAYMISHYFIHFFNNKKKQMFGRLSSCFALVLSTIGFSVIGNQTKVWIVIVKVIFLIVNEIKQ